MVHPDSDLTLREAFEKHYDKSDLSPDGLRTIHDALLRWERFTDNPAVGNVNNETISEFRRAMLERPYAPSTVRSTWMRVRPIFRRLAPDAAGFNPLGLGVIERLPYMKPVKVVNRRPYRIPLDDLSAFYRACRFAEFPKRGFKPAYWFQTLITTCYFTGLRRRDLFNLRFSQMDFDNGTIDFTAHKTGKPDCFILHPVAIAHLRRIAAPKRDKVFTGMYGGDGGWFSLEWNHIAERAGIKRKFTLHDIRRVGASEVDRIDRGIGKQFLQHAPRGVSEISYLNAADELADAIRAMRVPDAFAESIDLEPPRVDRRTDWTFDVDGATYRGRRIPLKGRPLALLRALVAAGPQRPLSFDDVRRIVFWDNPDISTTRIKVAAVQLRHRLRERLELPALWNPVAEAAKGAGYQLVLP